MRRLATVFVLALFATLLVGAARAELIQRGNLRVAFNGALLPHSLPRSHEAPVTVRLAGAVATVDGSAPPQLRQISIEVNRTGRLSIEGLPTCTAPELEQTSTKAAMDLCRGALVGRGHFAARVDFPSSPQIPAQGTVLAFNSRVAGRPAILLHLFGSSPVRATFVLPFKIKLRDHGKFGTIFATKIPAIAADLGYVTELNLSIGRRYSYGGTRHSYLSAMCAAPVGFPGASFQLAKATFTFANGQELTSSLLRDCTVR